jgi:hypothetical protein
VTDLSGAKYLRQDYAERFPSTLKETKKIERALKRTEKKKKKKKKLVGRQQPARNVRLEVPIAEPELWDDSDTDEEANIPANRKNPPKEHSRAYRTPQQALSLRIIVRRTSERAKPKYQS